MNKFRKNTSEIKTENFQKEEAPKFKKPERASEEIKLTGTIPVELHTQLIAYEYWNRLTHSEVLEEALTKLFGEKEIKSLPEKELKKNRPGRPKK